MPVTLPGTGMDIATETIGGDEYQWVKFGFGASGAFVLVSAANPLPVTQTGALPAGTNNVGKVDVNEFPASSRTTDTVGATVDMVNVANGLVALPVKFAQFDTAASGYTQVVAAVTGKKIRVLGYAMVAGGVVNAGFASASTAITPQFPLIANAGMSFPAGIGGACETAAGAALRINLSAAVSVRGHLSYIEV